VNSLLFLLIILLLCELRILKILIRKKASRRQLVHDSLLHILQDRDTDKTQTQARTHVMVYDSLCVFFQGGLS
jgi:hypothetical protein